MVTKLRVHLEGLFTLSFSKFAAFIFSRISDLSFFLQQDLIVMCCCCIDLVKMCYFVSLVSNLMSHLQSCSSRCIQMLHVP